MFQFKDDSDDDPPIIIQQRNHDPKPQPNDDNNLVQQAPQQVSPEPSSPTIQNSNDPHMTEVLNALTRSPSPQVSTKRPRQTKEESDNSDFEEPNVHVKKAPKTTKKSVQPKAGDYDEMGKEMVLMAANLYCILLASQGAFLNTSLEIKLVSVAISTLFSCLMDNTC